MKREIKGKIELKPIEFSQIFELEVKKANKTSGRVYLPANLVGKKIYVLVNEEERNEER